MTVSNSDNRKLHYPLSSPLTVDGETQPETVSNETVSGIFPLDSSQRINVVFNLSLDEYTMLATCVDIARDIGYGVDSYKVWLLWSRMVQGEIMLDCGDVADCVSVELSAGNAVLISSLVQNSINTGVGGNTNHINGEITTIPDRNRPTSLDEDIFPEFECNLDDLWAGIRNGIVQRLDDAARDVLEDLAAINDIPQRFQAFIDVIPVLGDIAEAIVILATEVIPDILNLYNAYSSEQQLDEIACDLFNMVCSECRYPTYREVYDYYSQLGYNLDGMDIQTVSPVIQKLSGMIAAVAPSSVVYNTMITFQLLILYIEAEFNGEAGKTTLYKYATLGNDYANDNWLQLCSGCTAQYMEYIFDFTKESYGSYRTGAFTGSIMSGDYIPGVGWRVSAINTTDGLMQVGLPFDPTWKVKAVAIDTSYPAGGTPNYWRTRIQSNSGANTVTGNMDTASAPYSKRQNFGVEISGFKEFAVRIPASLDTETALRRVAIKFIAGFAPSGSTLTNNPAFAP